MIPNDRDRAWRGLFAKDRRPSLVKGGESRALDEVREFTQLWRLFPLGLGRPAANTLRWS